MQIWILTVLPAVAYSALMAGGISDTTVDAQSEPVQFALQAVQTKLAAERPNLKAEYFSLVKVVSARTQVVAGQKLYLTLAINGGYYCKVDVWYRSWLQTADRLQIVDGPNCMHPTIKRAAAVGGVSDKHPLPSSSSGGTDEDSMVWKALQFAECYGNAMQNAVWAKKLSDTSGASYTQQVTSGMTYRFYDVTMVESDCKNDDCSRLDLAKCGTNASGHKYSCQFTVQSQPWMTPPMTLSDTTCTRM